MTTESTQHDHRFVPINVIGQRECERWICEICGAKRFRRTPLDELEDADIMASREPMVQPTIIASLINEVRLLVATHLMCWACEVAPETSELKGLLVRLIKNWSGDDDIPRTRPTPVK